MYTVIHTVHIYMHTVHIQLLVYVYSLYSYVGPPGQDRTFIVTQAPLEETVGDLWRLVWEEGIQTIVMLTEEFDKGNKLCEKCV